MSFKLDRVTALDITAIFADDKNKCYLRKIHITQIPNATVKGLDNYSDQIKSCESFVNDIDIKADIALCDIQDLNEANIIDHLLEVIDSLAYTVACHKHPNYYSHEYDKEDILIDAGLRKEFRDEILG